MAAAAGGGGVLVLPLHGGLPPSQQTRVFNRPPKGEGGYLGRWLACQVATLGPLCFAEKHLRVSELVASCPVAPSAAGLLQTWGSCCRAKDCFMACPPAVPYRHLPTLPPTHSNQMQAVSRWS